MGRAFTLWMAVCLCAGAWCATSAHGGEPAKAHTSYALIVSGASGEANFSENLTDWSKRWHAVLTKVCGVPAGQVRVLLEKKELAPDIASDVSTRANLQREMDGLAKKLKPGDQLILVFSGHGTVLGEISKLCLPGPDLGTAELAGMLDALPNREVIVVQAASASNAFVEALSRPGRVIMAASSDQGQGNATYFNEFLLGALEKKAGDANKDGKLTVMESFNHAATHCAKWYLRQYYEGSGVWRVEGRQTQALWKKFYAKVPDRKMTPGASGDDPEPELGEWGPQWASRRMVTETAQLDDNGDKQGTSVFVTNQFVPLVGIDKGLDGYLSAHTVWGAPRGDTQPPEKAAPAESTGEAEKGDAAAP